MAGQFGVLKTLEVIEDLKGISVSLVLIVKGVKSPWKIVDDCIRLAKSGTELYKDAPEALPELKELDNAEAALIGGAFYGLVKAVIEEIKKPK